MELTRNEQAKLRGLRRMKAVALAFLLGAAVVYALTRLYSNAPAWVGYVQAMAEASMVGALADWFAVTALFRHPLGLPIPHTAIIPNRKDQLGRGLGTFVQSNFLAPAVLSERPSPDAEGSLTPPIVPERTTGFAQPGVPFLPA